MRYLAFVMAAFFLLTGQASACVVVPAFEVRLDLAAAPDIPDKPWDFPTLEGFRDELEEFRVVSVEGFNRAVKAHTRALKRADRDLERRSANGRCTAEEYEDFHTQIADELAKNQEDRLEEYAGAIEAYKEKANRLRDAYGFVRNCKKYGCDDNVEA